MVDDDRKDENPDLSMTVVCMSTCISCVLCAAHQGGTSGLRTPQPGQGQRQREGGQGTQRQRAGSTHVLRWVLEPNERAGDGAWEGGGEG